MSKNASTVINVKIIRLKKQISSLKLGSEITMKEKFSELTVSLGDFTGYSTIFDLIHIIHVIDKKIYDIEHLNENMIKVRVKE